MPKRTRSLAATVCETRSHSGRSRPRRTVRAAASAPAAPALFTINCLLEMRPVDIYASRLTTNRSLTSHNEWFLVVEATRNGKRYFVYARSRSRRPTTAEAETRLHKTRAFVARAAGSVGVILVVPVNEVPRN